MARTTRTLPSYPERTMIAIGGVRPGDVRTLCSFGADAAWRHRVRRWFGGGGNLSEAEAIFDVVTGGVVAAAVDPDDRGTAGAQAGACLNCGTALTGGYCHACGQAAHVHRTLGAFWHEFLHGVLHFEGKVWRTLPMLAWHPGALTRRYVAGERARFVSPLALFLFCVFLTFAVIGWTGGPFGNSEENLRLDDGASIAQGIERADRKIAALEMLRVETIAAGKPTAAIDAKISDARKFVSKVRSIKERGVVEATLADASNEKPTSLDWFNAAYFKAKANPSLLLYKLQNNAYKYSWALIPISVPFMWLLFPFSRKFRLYDHAVFVTYSLCFVTLLVVFVSLVRAAGIPKEITDILFLVVPPVHMYRQRGAYGLRWWSALARTVVLACFCLLTVTLFALMLVALGVLG